jgi:fructosamine-3-kinase
MKQTAVKNYASLAAVASVSGTDPASYAGIAMTEFSGRFLEPFYKSYNEVNCLQNGYERRRDLYNLYQLLNHLNLFGDSYLEPVHEIVGEYV